MRPAARAASPTGLFILLVAVGAAGEPDAVAPAPLDGLSAELRERLDRDRIVLIRESDGAEPAGRHMRAFVLFEQPRKRVLDLLGETWRQAEFRPDVDRIDVIERGPDGSLDEHHLRVLFTNMAYRLRYRLDREAARITWQLDPDFDNDVSRVEGFWELHEWGEVRTLGHFGTLVDVGPYLPAFLQDAVTRKNVPRTLERCRRWVDAGGEK